MGTLVRSCPYCGKTVKFPMPAPTWSAPQECPGCRGKIGCCTARREPFFFHLFKIPEAGQDLHTCTEHAGPR